MIKQVNTNENTNIHSFGAKKAEKVDTSTDFTSRKFKEIPLDQVEVIVEQIRAEYSLLSLGFKVEVVDSVANMTVYRSTSFMVADGAKPLHQLTDDLSKSAGLTLDFHVRLGKTYIPAPINETCEIVLGE